MHGVLATLMFLLLGAAVAVALPVVADDPLGMASTLHVLGHDTTLRLLTSAGAPDEFSEAAALLAGTLLPGLACLLVVEAIAASHGLRRVASFTMIFAAIGSFWVLDGGQALGLLLVALVFSVLLWMGTALVTAPISFCIGYLGASFALVAGAGDNEHLSAYGVTLDSYLDLNGWWPLVLAVLAVAPLAGCVARLLRSR